MPILNHLDRPSRLAVTNQPQAILDLGSLDLKQPIPLHEKTLEASLDREQNCHCEHGQTSSSTHHNCHNIRLRRLLLPAVLALLVLGGLLAWNCANWHGLSNWGFDNLVGRALDDSSSNPSQSPFIQHKLWLIVLFVGLLLVLILGIMLSAWCCKESFKNPCCCPCYLCECCGGLVCLECIGECIGCSMLGDA